MLIYGMLFEWVGMNIVGPVDYIICYLEAVPLCSRTALTINNTSGTQVGIFAEALTELRGMGEFTSYYKNFHSSFETDSYTFIYHSRWAA